ncbi:MAG: CNNM domain-containing protein [Bacteroidota bacterium]
MLIFAEFIPRAIFRARSLSLLSGLALVADFFYQMFSPLAAGLINLAEWLLKYVFNVRVDPLKEPF